jgi:pyruvate formate lyase activating enzyme
MHEASYYLRQDNKKVKCLLCPHYCQISPESTGICRTRKNIDGKLLALNYGKTVTVSLDPIEKKPLYHYYPGKDILSIGANYCNLRCDYCQNYSISQMESKTIELSPASLLQLCLKHNVSHVAYTYTEPLIWFEYILEAARLLHENNISSVLVTNGYINREPFAELLPYIAAINFDLKGMSDEFYQRVCGGTLQPVLETIKSAAGKCHLEITNLLIPGENDSEKMLNDLVSFIAETDPNIPLHFSRYFPQYKRHTTPTSPKTLENAYNLAKEKLNYVYLGNILSESHSNTYCPGCHTLLIERKSYNVINHNLQKNRCSNCSTVIYGIF